jgi:hypothetical protein
MTGLVSRTGVVWRYLDGGRCRHAVPQWTHHVGHAPRAVCGLETFRAEDWHGSGSQVEYETATSLPECRRCVARLTPPASTEGSAR